MGAYVPISAQPSYKVKAVLIEAAFIVKHLIVNVNGNHLADHEIPSSGAIPQCNYLIYTALKCNRRFSYARRGHMSTRNLSESGLGKLIDSASIFGA